MDIFKELFGRAFFGESNFPKDDDKNFNKTVDEIETDSHVIKKETWKSIDGKQFYQRTTSRSKSPMDYISISDLKNQLNEAVSEQNFEKAALLRDKIKELE